MDDFQNIGSFLQLMAMLVLLLKMACTMDCTGISGRTQVLHALVFTMRFLDLPHDFRISLLSFIIKIIYLLLAYLTVLLIFVICRRTYEREHDTFRFDLLVGCCTVMALFSSYKDLEILTILWYLSVFLETFAIFPQIHFTMGAKYVGSSLLFYVGLLACYRAFYIVHWAYQLIVDKRVDNYCVAASGAIQFLVYCGFFIWMVPTFKAQYVHLRNSDSRADSLTVVTVMANGGDDKIKKAEHFYEK